MLLHEIFNQLRFIQGSFHLQSMPVENMKPVMLHNTITNVENIYVNMYIFVLLSILNIHAQEFKYFATCKKFLSVHWTFQQTKNIFWPVAIPLLIYIFYVKFLSLKNPVVFLVFPLLIKGIRKPNLEAKKYYLS